MRTFIQIRDHDSSWINADHIISISKNKNRGDAKLLISGHVGMFRHEYSVLSYEEVQRLLIQGGSIFGGLAISDENAIG